MTSGACRQKGSEVELYLVVTAPAFHHRVIQVHVVLDLCRSALLHCTD